MTPLISIGPKELAQRIREADLHTVAVFLQQLSYELDYVTHSVMDIARHHLVEASKHLSIVAAYKKPPVVIR